MFHERNPRKRKTYRRPTRPNSYTNSSNYRRDRRLNSRRTQIKRNRDRDRNKHNDTSTLKAFGIASSILAISTSFIAFLSNKNNDSFLKDNVTPLVDKQFSNIDYPFDIFGDLEHPVYRITREDPVASPDLISTYIDSNTKLTRSEDFSKLMSDNFYKLKEDVYLSLVKIELLKESLKYKPTKYGQNEISREEEVLKSLIKQLKDNKNALLKFRPVIKTSNFSRTFEDKYKKINKDKKFKDDTDYIKAQIYAEKVFLYLTGQPVPEHISYTYVDEFEDNVLGNSEVRSGKINIKKIYMPDTIDTLLHELGHQIANNNLELYTEKNLSDNRIKYLRAREEASAYAFALAGAEVLKNDIPFGDPEFNEEIGIFAQRQISSFTISYYNKRSKTEELLENEHYLGAAMVDAALIVFKDPIEAYNHLATSKELDPRIEQILVDTLEAYKTCGDKFKDYENDYEERIFEYEWLISKLEEKGKEATSLAIRSHFYNSQNILDASLIEADRLFRFASLIKLISKPEITEDKLKDVNQVSKFYPRLTHVQHLMIVQFAKEFYYPKPGINEYALGITPVGELTKSLLELADRETADLILKNLLIPNIRNSGSDRQDNDNDGEIDYSDINTLDPNGIFHFYREENYLDKQLKLCKEIGSSSHKLCRQIRRSIDETMKTR